MTQIQPTGSMPPFDHDLLVVTERKYNKLLREQRSSRQALGDLEEARRLKNLQREKARCKQEMQLFAFDRYIRNVYQREREIKEEREREMNRGGPARNGPSQTPLVGHFQNVWQGIPIPRVAAASISNVSANGHIVGGSQRPFSRAAVASVSSAIMSGQSVGGSPHSDRRWNPEAKAFQSKPSCDGVVKTPQACSHRCWEQPWTTQATPEDIPASSGARRDSGYGSSSTSPTKIQSGTSQKVPVETLMRTIEESFAEQQEQPAAVKAELVITGRGLTYVPGWGLDNIDEIPTKSWVPRILREGYDKRYERLQNELEAWEANRTRRATMFANAGIESA